MQYFYQSILFIINNMFAHLDRTLHVYREILTLSVGEDLLMVFFYSFTKKWRNTEILLDPHNRIVRCTVTCYLPLQVL